MFGFLPPIILIAEMSIEARISVAKDLLDSQVLATMTTLLAVSGKVGWK